MQAKEMLYVAIGAVVLTNASILGTLYLSGKLGDHSESQEQLSELENAQDGEGADDTLKPEPEPVSRVGYLHTLADAMYLCEERLISENNQHLKSYNVNHKTSRYRDEDDIYFVFIEMETVGTLEKPSQAGDIYCEVSPETKSVSSYQMVMREDQ